MTSIKDKLASSVRQAKTGAESAPAEAEKEKAETRKAPRSASATAKAAAAKPAPTESLAGEPPDSGQELFPDRIWPD
jgi:hypothetical protein